MSAFGPRGRWSVAFLFAAIIVSSPLHAADAEIQQLPDEYESTSGMGGALNNGGYAANDPVSAIRANPALMTQQKQYLVAGGYHWPTEGREYYQASVVDSRTSNVAAGVTYTGYNEDYAYPNADHEVSRFDSPIVRRGVLGLAQSFGQLSMGVGGTYVEAHEIQRPDPWGPDRRVKGFGLNAGGAYNFGNGLSAGAAVENVSNKKIRDYAPKTLKGGLAYAVDQNIVAMIDYRQRDRVAGFEGGLIDFDRPASEVADLEAEEMGIASFSAGVAQYLRILGSYAMAMKDERRSAGAGLVLTGNNFTLSYALSRPYMSRGTTHQAITLGVDIAM